jgi:hypothetical protein
MKLKRSVILGLLGMVTMIVLGCGAGYTPTPTPEPQNPGEIAMTMVAQKVDAEATQMAVNVQFTATAQVVWATQNSQNTQIAVAVTEQARKDVMATEQQSRRDAAATQARRDAEATEVQYRRDVEATAQQYEQNVIGTATAQQAAIWNGMTQSAVPTHAAWTQQAVEAEQTLTTNKLQLSDLEVEQQRQTNTISWFVPYSAAIAAVIVVAVVMLRRSRVHEVKNEDTGVVEGLLLDTNTLIRPQLLTGPVLKLEKDGPHVPQVSDPGEQSEVTRRAQAIEALRAMPTQQPTANATLMANSVFSESKKPVIEVLEPGQASRIILDELSDQVVEEE